MIYDFDNWRANMVLEALQTLNEKWQAMIDSTEDVDVKADYANDMIGLHIFQEGFERIAVGEFGSGITSFSREPVQVITPPITDDLRPRKSA